MSVAGRSFNESILFPSGGCDCPHGANDDNVGKKKELKQWKPDHVTKATKAFGGNGQETRIGYYFNKETESDGITFRWRVK